MLCQDQGVREVREEPAATAISASLGLQAPQHATLPEAGPEAPHAQGGDQDHGMCLGFLKTAVNLLMVNTSTDLYICILGFLLPPTQTQEKERGERVWRERLQRCQRQLKAKEDEMCRQSQYFENFKTQLQHKLSLACDREQSLQTRIYTLEKQLLDMTVSAATGMVTIRAARITAGTVTQMEEKDRFPSMRGEGEGEEEKKEERRRQWQPSVGIERGERQEGDEGKTAKDVEGGRIKDGKQTSNEARLQGFIISLQEDLRVLLEREEDRMTEQRGLMEQLHEAQENNHFLGCRVEEMKVEVHQLKLSESSLMEEVEELREENERLHQILRDAANQTLSQSSIAESTHPSPGTTSPSCSPVISSMASSTLFTTAMGLSSVDNLGEVSKTEIMMIIIINIIKSCHPNEIKPQCKRGLNTGRKHKFTHTNSSNICTTK